MKRRLLLSVLLALAACAREPQEGERYLAALSDAIRQADRIVVTEHSFKYDAYDMDNGKSLLPQTVVYKTVELNPAQRDAFLSTVEQLDSKTQDAFAACIFEPHHTIHFHAKGKLRSTMQICFACGQVQWDEGSATPPASLYRGLDAAIKAMGLEPTRDWPALATAHLRTATQQSPR